MSERTVHDRLMAATSILQMAILARESTLDAQKMWGTFNLPSLALEEALSLVISTLEDVENI